MEKLDFTVAYDPSETNYEEVLKILREKLQLTPLENRKIVVSYWPIEDPLDQPDAE